MKKSYKDLDVYNESLNLFYRIHEISLKLPKHELYELGSQIRRSGDSVNSNIVEGYGRSDYKWEFVRFLSYSHGSSLETQNHYEKLKMLYPEHHDTISIILLEYEQLGKKIFNFKQYVVKNWKGRVEIEKSTKQPN